MDSDFIPDNFDFAVLDSHRAQRTGYPEAVYCRGKTVEQAQAIIEQMRHQGIPVLATHASPDLAERLRPSFSDLAYDELSKVLTIGQPPEPAGLVMVVAAGTSDLPYAREALLTSQFLGSRTEIIADVGVAGIHRLFHRLEQIRQANVVIAVAGMEGALASVLAGLVSIPVIALPTSVGYGANFGGLSALLGMLNSCAPGLATVNIDNGFGAGYLANQINRLITTRTP